MTLRWNRKAEWQWYQTALYLHRTFGHNATRRFMENVIQWQERIAVNPEIGAPEPLLSGRRYLYRSIVIHEHCRLVYYLRPTVGEIRIAALWDTRRNPDSLVSTL